MDRIIDYDRLISTASALLASYTQSLSVGFSVITMVSSRVPSGSLRALMLLIGSTEGIVKSYDWRSIEDE